MKDGAVWCWGDVRVERGPAAQIGTSRRTLRTVLDEARERLLSVSQNRSGYGCGVFEHDIRCWDMASPELEPLKVPGRFAAVWTGEHSACARTQEGSVSCWGTGVPWLDPHEVLEPTSLPGLAGADEVGICETTVCTRRGTSVRCTPRFELEGLRSGTPHEGNAVDVKATRLACCHRGEWRAPKMCALTTAGDVVCWPGSEDGAAPPGYRTAWSSTAAQADGICTVSDPPAPGVVSAIDAANTACFLEEGGTVACTGTPAQDGVELDAKRIHPLPGVLRATDFIVDPYEWCARSKEASWSCWPRMHEHSPTGMETSWDVQVAPRPLPGIDGVAAVAQNRFAFCLSDANDNTRCRPYRVEGFFGEDVLLSHVRKLSIGNNHACALDRNGRLSCWGANESGQVSAGVVDAPLVTVPTRTMDDVTDVAVGLRHTCAILRDGSVVCFGDNRSGQLGNGSTRTAHGIVRVDGLGARAIGLAAAFDHTCALTEERSVLCWGASSQDATSLPDAALRPAKVQGLSGDVKEIAAGGLESCALLASGSVACWWHRGMAGDPVAPRPIEGTEGTEELAMGDSHACVRSLAGRVRCWGSNGAGQLGASLPWSRYEAHPPKSCPAVTYSRGTGSASAVDVVW